MNSLEYLHTKPDPRLGVPKELVLLNNLANRKAFKVMGFRDTCILVSTMLNHLLVKLGYQSRCVRISACVMYAARNRSGRQLGGPEFGRRPKTEPGMWQGHLGVLVSEKWLLDPTLDQVRGMEPVAFQIVSLDPWEKSTYFNIGDATVRYNIYRGKQWGFKNAPDTRPSHWREIYTSVVSSRTFRKHFQSKLGGINP